MLGELIEFDRTDKIFTAPSEKLTEDYVTGGLADEYFDEELQQLKEKILKMLDGRGCHKKFGPGAC